MFEKLLYTLAAMIVLGVVGSGCSGQKKEAESHQVKVTTVQSSSHLFQQRLRVQGVTIAVEKAVLKARSNGVLEIMAVDDGSVVKKGDLLFQIDKENLEKKLALAEKEVTVAEDNVRTVESDLQIAEDNLDKAQRDYKRAVDLRSEEVISIDAYEKADVYCKICQASVNKVKAMLAYSKSRVEQQKASLEIARKNLVDSKGVAPFDGVITRKLSEQGEYPGEGALGKEILHIENPDNLEISCLISALYYDSVAVGKTKLILLADEKKLGEAVLTYRSPSIDPMSRTFEIKAKLDPKLGITSGMLCDVDMVLRERTGLGLPVDTIMLRAGGKSVAYYNNNGKAELLEITPGITSDGYTEVLNAESLQGKDFVATGQYFLNPGDSVVLVQK